MKKDEKKEALTLQVNEKLYDELFVQELEQRLETDPLAANSFAGLFADSSIEPVCGFNICGRHIEGGIE